MTIESKNYYCIFNYQKFGFQYRDSNHCLFYNIVHFAMCFLKKKKKTCMLLHYHNFTVAKLPISAYTHQIKRAYHTTNSNANKNNSKFLHPLGKTTAIYKGGWSNTVAVFKEICLTYTRKVKAR